MRTEKSSALCAMRPGRGGQGAHRDSDTEAVTAHRLWPLATIHRAGATPEQVRADQIGGEPPGEERTQHGADHAELQHELQQVVVRVGKVEAIRMVRQRLMAKVNVAIRAEPDPEDGELAQQRQRGDVLREPIERPGRRLGQSRDPGTEADPPAVRDDGDQQGRRCTTRLRRARPEADSSPISASKPTTSPIRPPRLSVKTTATPITITPISGR